MLVCASHAGNTYKIQCVVICRAAPLTRKGSSMYLTAGLIICLQIFHGRGEPHPPGQLASKSEIGGANRKEAISPLPWGEGGAARAG